MIKKRTYLYLFLIILAGFLLRCSNIDKFQGLWNDEYISWFISVQSFSDNFFQSIFKNCHMPLYYFYLKIWQVLFGSTDLSLRVSSLVPGCLSIISMFFLGKCFKDEKLGLLTASLTAVSGFLIYFSQEVRFYSLLFLISSVSLIFFIKTLQKQSFLNLLCSFLFNLLIMLTHTIGFVFVFFYYLILFVLLKKNNNFSNKYIYGTVIFFIMVMMPLIPFMYRVFTGSYISQFWSNFSFAKLLFVFADYVSPVQINIINTPVDIKQFFYKDNHPNYGYVLFAVIPLFISFLAYITAFKKKNEYVFPIFLIMFFTLSVMVIASLAGKLVLITKYTVEIYPVFIVLFAYGLYMFRPVTIRKLLLIAFFGLSLWYLTGSDFAPQKLPRSEGHKQVADLINEANMNSDDYVILLYYDKNRFGKYINLDNYIVQSVNKFNFQYSFMDNPGNHYDIVKNGKSLFKECFKSGSCLYLDNYLRNVYFNNMKKGNKLALVSLDSVAFIDEPTMKKIVEDDTRYSKTPFLFLIFSFIKNDIKNQADLNLKMIYQEQKGKWSIMVWEKI